MRINHYKLLTILIFIYTTGCTKDNKWKGVGKFEINRKESYNYSEIISGELDSTTKNDLEKFKQHSIKKNEELEELPFNKRIKQVAENSIKRIKQLYENIFYQKNKNN